MLASALISFLVAVQVWVPLSPELTADRLIDGFVSDLNMQSLQVDDHWYFNICSVSGPVAVQVTVTGPEAALRLYMLLGLEEASSGGK